MTKIRLSRSEREALSDAINAPVRNEAFPLASPALADSEDALHALLRRPNIYRRPRELATALVHFGHLARAKGLLYIERFIPSVSDTNLNTLLRLIVNGTDPALVAQVALHLGRHSTKRSAPYADVLRFGIEMLQSGSNPSQMTEALWAILGEVPTRPPDRPELVGDVGEVLSQADIDRLLGARKRGRSQKRKHK